MADSSTTPPHGTGVNPNGAGAGALAALSRRGGGVDGNDAIQTRAEIVGRILSSANFKRRSEIVDFFGEKIEVRGPSLGEVISDNEAGANGTLVITILTKYTYVPGTDVRMFDETNRDELLQLPQSKAFVSLIRAFERLTGGTVDAAEKN